MGGMGNDVAHAPHAGGPPRSYLLISLRVLSAGFVTLHLTTHVVRAPHGRIWDCGSARGGASSKSLLDIFFPRNVKIGTGIHKHLEHDDQGRTLGAAFVEDEEDSSPSDEGEARDEAAEAADRTTYSAARIARDQRRTSHQCGFWVTLLFAAVTFSLLGALVWFYYPDTMGFPHAKVGEFL